VFVKKLSSFSLAVSLGLISNVVLASNFGDLPAVLPFLVVIIGFFFCGVGKVFGSNRGFFEKAVPAW
jgi:hypothetical protein